MNTVKGLDALFERDRLRLQALGRQARNALLAFQAFRRRPILNITQVAAETNLSFPTANSMAELLVRQGIVREVTGKQRNRLFVYQDYLNMLDDGQAP